MDLQKTRDVDSLFSQLRLTTMLTKTRFEESQHGRTTQMLVDKCPIETAIPKANQKEKTHTLKTGVFDNTPRCVLVHTKVCTIAHKGV